ncbi:hypothetical protein [Stomatohabitans albus]|uniref:hypothetical protein n=1 Tax=Stomatohabitans albus TaxID=3110766 RepID=UPI00300C91E8
MDVSDAQEALRWAQGKRTLIQAIGEWSALGARVSVRMSGGTLVGFIAEWGEDWVCLTTSSKHIYIPEREIEFAEAEIGSSRPGRYRDQTWIGCIRSLNTSGGRVGIALRSGQLLYGIIAVVAKDHIRLIQQEGDDGALGPIVPVVAISCLWQQIA